MTNAFSKPTTNHWVFDLYGKKRYRLQKCFINSMNARHVLEQLADTKLKIVIGTMSVNGFMEFGGSAKHMEKNMDDSHVWLEDEDGNVWDYVFEHYNHYAEVNTGRSLPAASFMLTGVSKQDADEIYGVRYAPVSKSLQKRIANHWYGTTAPIDEGCHWRTIVI